MEESTNPFASIIGALQSKGGAKGVVKDSEGKVSPSLTPSEAARYEKIFGIMKKVVSPEPEAGKVDRGGAAAKVGNTAAMQKIKSSGGGFQIPGLGAIAGLAGAAGILGAALTTMSEDFMAKVNKLSEGFIEFGDNAGDELGKLPAIAAKIAKFLPLKFLKTLPFIGSLVNFYYAYDHFNKGEYFDGGWELVSGIMNFLPGGAVVSPLMDGYKIYAEVLANKQAQETGKKPEFKDILGSQAKELGKFIHKKIASGKVPILSGLYRFGEGIGLMATGEFKQGFEAWADILPNLLGMSWDSPMFKALDAMYTIAGEGVNDAVQSGSRMAGEAWGFMKDVFDSIGNTFKGFFNGVVSWIDEALAAGQNTLIDIANKVPFVDLERVEQGKKDPFFKIDDGTITKDGRVTRFDDQDDILAAKKDGPIDKMLDGNSKIMKSIADINTQQLNVLIEIRNGINALQSSGGLTFSDNSLTKEFYA